MRKSVTAILAAIGLTTAALASIHVLAQQGDGDGNGESDGWLTGASDTDEQMLLLENYLRGFSTSMRETGDRFQSMHQAIEDENYALASYQWDKLREAIELGIMKRPDRAENAVTMFLGEPWTQLSEALESGEREAIVERFNVARNVCMACHAAEGVPWMNDMPMFRDTEL